MLAPVHEESLDRTALTEAAVDPVMFLDDVTEAVRPRAAPRGSPGRFGHT